MGLYPRLFFHNSGRLFLLQLQISSTQSDSGSIFYTTASINHRITSSSFLCTLVQSPCNLYSHSEPKWAASHEDLLQCKQQYTGLFDLLHGLALPQAAGWLLSHADGSNDSLDSTVFNPRWILTQTTNKTMLHSLIVLSTPVRESCSVQL